MLLTGFRRSSAEQLILAAHGCDTLLLPNDKQRDAELLAYQLLNTRYDFILCIGQRPNIKDKIHIETTARENDVAIQTTVDCQKLAHLFRVCGLQAKLSNNAGSSFCNTLYFKGLQFVRKHDLNAGLVFIHIPFLKNMGCPDSFATRFLNVIDHLKENGVEDVWIK